MAQGPGAAQDEELKAHGRAYLQIFQAVLNKIPVDADAKKQRFARVRQYLQSNIKSTDDFLNHIGSLAQLIGVKEAQLSSFVGANFLKALDMVQKQIAKERQAAAHAEKGASVSTTGGGAASTASVASSGGASAPAAGASKSNVLLIEELLGAIGGLVEPGGKFIPIDMGLLKFVGPGGREVMPTSMTGGAPAADAAAPPAAEEKKSGPTIIKRTVARPEPKAAPVMVKEQSIISEILEKFGNVLDIPGKLEYDPFPPDNAGGSAAAAQAAPATPTAPAPTSAPASGGARPVAAPVKSKSAQARVPEKPIIGEILEQFGNVLDIPGKLVPTTGLEGGGEFGDSGAAAQAGGAPTSVPDGRSGMSAADDFGADEEDDDFIPIELNFQEYLGVLRKLQEFQQSGDAAAYRAWLNAGAGQGGKALVGLRNLETRAQGGTVNWDAEYANLSRHLDADSPAAVRDVHDRTKKFSLIQKLINQIKMKLQKSDPSVVGAMKKIWSQLLILFSEQLDAHGYSSQFKIALLQVGDAGLRAKLEQFMEPVFRELEKIYGS